jgi:hypothetical protein
MTIRGPNQEAAPVNLEIDCSFVQRLLCHVQIGGDGKARQKGNGRRRMPR